MYYLLSLLSMSELQHDNTHKKAQNNLCDHLEVSDQLEQLGSLGFTGLQGIFVMSQLLLSYLEKTSN